MASANSTGSPLSESHPFSSEKGSTKLGEIVAFIDGCIGTEGILEFASVLAEQHSARLISVFMQPHATVTPAETFARGKGIQRVFEVHRAELDAVDAEHRALFERIVRRHGIQSEWRSVPYMSTEVAVHAYYADLVVVARPEPADETAGPPGLAESLILSSGRPIIVFPLSSNASRIRRILVGWNARRESIRAVADALPLLAMSEAVEVLVIGDQQHSGGHGEEPGADIARRLARHGAQVEVRHLTSGGDAVGHLLLSRTASFGADLLVMGAYGHSHLSEWVFGSVTRTVLREASLPVLMSR
ncbi:MAG TPA: universal stress protein [Candidatus Acidoferrum sp.]|nr:universal stress protein [Candidatus Acidoferrum sp.]